MGGDSNAGGYLGTGSVGMGTHTMVIVGKPIKLACHSWSKGCGCILTLVGCVRVTSVGVVEGKKSITRTLGLINLESFDGKQIQFN